MPPAGASGSGMAHHRAHRKVCRWLGWKPVFTDPDYSAEEPQRLAMWLDPAFPRELSRYMIWDYARVMLLYR
jgi:hypothetical protein